MRGIIVVVGVSADSVKAHKRFAEKQELNFHLLADTEKTTIEAYQAWGEKKRCGKTYEGILRITYVVGPDGTIIHQASVGREIIAVEMDFSHVRRVRERGLHGLGQPLKSFRDANFNYPVYQEGAGPGAFAELGPLAIPGRDKF